MKFDVNVFRYIEKDAWRVLVSVEMGMKNHELVPKALISSSRWRPSWPLPFLWHICAL